MTDVSRVEKRCGKGTRGKKEEVSMHRRWSLSHLMLAAVLTCAAVFATPSPVQAGCGCTKPAPAPASVRPNVTYGGQKVNLFHPSLVNGGSYTVKFTAMNGVTASVSATAANRRDLADVVYKNQLIVTVPSSLPLGPVGITVTQAGQTAPFLSIPDTSFTLAPQPVVVPSQPGSYNYQNYKAAVGRDGKVYISLDVTGMVQPRTIKAQARGWALRFTKDNAVFYNTQGFLMQLVNAPIPGLATITPSSSADSDVLQYQRHEFNTYFLQHAEQLPHSTDPSDSNWHTDGTRHINHDHLILAIAGKVNNVAPAAGSTPEFTFALNTHTFFHNGITGASSLEITNNARTDSYNSVTSLPGSQGDVWSNGQIRLDNNGVVSGNATGASFSIANNSYITGTRTTLASPASFLAVDIPQGLPNLGDLNLTNNATRTLVGPASYRVGTIIIDNGGRLIINNSAGPVTLYIAGPVTISNNGLVTVADADPEKLAFYLASTSPVSIDNGGSFYGAIYAPQSPMLLSNNGQFYGSFVGNSVKVDNGAQVHFDTALRGE